MFDKNMFITRGIKSNLDWQIVCALWQKLQEIKERKPDYLQVFELTNIGSENDKILEVKWSQEQPEHIETFYLNGLETDVKKVWVICTAEGTSDEYSTMLLPEEY